MKTKTNQSGFTLIELVMVILILGILAAIALPKFTDLSDNAKTAAIQGVAGAIASGSAANFAAKKLNVSTAITVSAADVCSQATLGSLLQGSPATLPSVVTGVSGPGNCSGSADTVTCSLAGAASPVSATVYCAR